MVLPRWTRLASSLVHANPWWQYFLHTFVQPDGRRGEYHEVRTTGSVMIVAVDASGRLVIVEQYRFLVDHDSLEFPAGGIDGSESPLEAATRELAEETRLSGTLTPIGVFCPWNGVTSELCHVFAACDLAPAEDPPPIDDTEHFVLHRMSPESFEARVADGTITDGMTLAAYTMFRLSEAGRRAARSTDREVPSAP